MTGCMADEVCLNEGLCARQSTELRYCVKTCSSGDDCRAGYECRLAGTRGSMALTSNPDASSTSARRERDRRLAAPRRAKPEGAAADNRSMRFVRGLLVRA